MEATISTIPLNPVGDKRDKIPFRCYLLCRCITLQLHFMTLDFTFVKYIPIVTTIIIDIGWSLKHNLFSLHCFIQIINNDIFIFK